MVKGGNIGVKSRVEANTVGQDTRAFARGNVSHLPSGRAPKGPWSDDREANKLEANLKACARYREHAKVRVIRYS